MTLIPSRVIPSGVYMPGRLVTPPLFLGVNGTASHLHLPMCLTAIWALRILRLLQFENLVAVRQCLSLVASLCVFLIFLLLFSAFNSVKYAVLVFTGLPLALTRGILSLWLRDMPYAEQSVTGVLIPVTAGDATERASQQRKKRKQARSSTWCASSGEARPEPVPA